MAREAAATHVLQGTTSFEREYKRKVYEPDENANAGEFSKETVDAERNATLYGKIEL